MVRRFTPLAVAVLCALSFVSSAGASEMKRWLIVYNQHNGIPNGAEAAIASAGGAVVARLDEIGVALAESSDPGFATAMSAKQHVAGVTEDVVVPMIPSAAQLNITDLESASAVEPPGSDTQTGTEPFYNAFQWDKKRMRASNQGSYAVQQGRRDVVVAVLDTGADVLPIAHGDIAPNLDFARSRSFFPAQPSPNGDPNPAAWDDKNGHGSWCLSAVGAPINGQGISGVAPNVTLVALKVLGDNGSGSYGALAQALIYAGVNRFDVASMSLGGYLRRADQGTHVLIKVVQRAVNFARASGVTPIAALSNEAFNISDGDFMRDFMLVPGEIDGVIGVSATGYFNWKASYSNYGVGKTDISAPGGDFAVQTTPTLPGLGSVVGAWAREVFASGYAFASGTSMACPNAAGVVALIISQYGDFTPDNSRKLHMSPQAVEAILQQTANNQPCPEPREVTYVTAVPLPGLPAGTPLEPFNQRCQGDAGYNNFFGKGMVDALKAVTQ
jgi:lantibiotic leader peptide-processing serine protease